ncbi:MAG: hypothetical protein QG634_137 [Patescibacteria group bacterium]|nr:hypothetical protein [Patescibacteria group bacterium]
MKTKKGVEMLALLRLFGNFGIHKAFTKVPYYYFIQNKPQIKPRTKTKKKYKKGEKRKKWR